jgi:hypothetical protein
VLVIYWGVYTSSEGEMLMSGNEVAPPPLAYPSVGAAAAAIGISRAGLYQAIRRGELVAKKIGVRTVVEHAELRRFLASRPAAKLTPMPVGSYRATSTSAAA